MKLHSIIMKHQKMGAEAVNNCFAPLFAKGQMGELIKRKNVQLVLQRLYFLGLSTSSHSAAPAKMQLTKMKFLY